jgi:lysophospholipase L1-like esterase
MDACSFRPRRDHAPKRKTERWSALLDGSFAKTAPEKEAAAPPTRPGLLRAFVALWLGREAPQQPPAPRPGPGDYLAQAGVEADVLLTTMPAPPQFVSAWRRHLNLMSRSDQPPADLLLVGDSLAEWWPEQMFEGLSVFNFGLAGDRTQHLLWRLMQAADGSLKARCALVVVGVNNLGSGDSSEAIVAGVARVTETLAQKSTAETTVILEIPPMGRDFSFRAAERLRANEKLRALGFPTLNVDEALMGGSPGPSPNYAEDGIHFSEAGYALLTSILRSSFLEPGAL